MSQADYPDWDVSEVELADRLPEEQREELEQILQRHD
jgi:hypothetical protein